MPIPPDSTKRTTARPGWDGGRYSWMRRLLATLGRELYSHRHQTIEPVFGQIKHIRKIDRFHRRGRTAVRNELRLAAATHNPAANPPGASPIDDHTPRGSPGRPEHLPDGHIELRQRRGENPGAERLDRLLASESGSSIVSDRILEWRSSTRGPRRVTGSAANAAGTWSRPRV